MIEFGKTLREAREAKGLTTAQIAEKTHMMVQVVEGLEHEDFSRIVAPIYGRGFVKLYCESVGLDPKPIVDAFMEIYPIKRTAAPVLQPPPLASKPPPEPEPAPEPEPEAPQPPPEPSASEPPARPMELDFSGIRTASPQPEPAPKPLLTPKPIPTTTIPPPAPKPATSSAPSRYSAPMPIDDKPPFSLPEFLSSVNWRLVALVAATATLLALVALGIRAVYHATMTAPSDGPAPQETPAANPKAPAQKDAQKDAKPVQRDAKISAKPAEKPASKDVKISARPDAKDAKDAKPATARKPLPPRDFYIDSDHSSTKKEGK